MIRVAIEYRSESLHLEESVIYSRLGTKKSCSRERKRFVPSISAFLAPVGSGKGKKDINLLP